MIRGQAGIQSRQAFQFSSFSRRLREPDRTVKPDACRGFIAGIVTKFGVLVIHKGIKQFFRILGGIAFAILIAVGTLAWRLDQGPVALEALTPYLEDALSNREAGIHVSIDGTELRWDHGPGSVGLRLQETRVTDGQGALVARFPELGITVDPWWLVQGQIYPRTIQIINPAVLMIRDADGQIRLGITSATTRLDTTTDQGEKLVQETGATEETANFIQGVIAALTDRAPSDGTMSGQATLSRLSLLQISSASLVIEDKATGTAWHIPEASLDMIRTRGQLDFDADLEVATSSGTTHLDLTGHYSASSRHLETRLEARDLRPSALAGLAGVLAPLAGIDIPLSGTVETRFSLDKTPKILSGTAHITGSTGTIQIPEPIEGRIPVKKLSLSLTSGPMLQQLDLENFTLNLDGTTITAQGRVNPGTGMTPPGGNVTVLVDTLPVNRIKELWPTGVAPNPRTWITENLQDGTVHDGSWSFDLGPNDHGAIMVKTLSGTAQAKGVTVHYLRPMPPVANTDATLTFSTDRIAIAVGGGSAGNLKVTGGTISLEKLDQDDNDAIINLAISGPLPEALALIDSKPLGYARKVGIIPEKTSGHVDTDLELTFPLLTDLPLDRLSVRTNVRGKGVSVAGIVFSQDLKNAAITMTVTAQDLKAEGQGSIGGIPARFTWLENFSGQPFASQYLVDAVIEQDRRPVVGLTFPPFDGDWIQGPVTVKADMTTQSDGASTLKVNADLTATRAEIPELGWIKPSGIQGQAKATILLRGQNVTEVPSFSAKVDKSLTIAGALNVGRNSTLADLRLNTVQINQTNAKVRIRPSADGDGLNITASGPILDLSPLFTANGAEGHPQQDPDRTPSPADDAPVSGVVPGPLTVAHLNFDRVLMSKHGGLHDLKISASSRNERFESMQVTGTVDDGGPVEFRISSSSGDDKRAMILRTSDAGALARVLGIVTTMREGELDVTGTLSRHGVARGTANVSRYRLVEAPLLARILSVAALTGILDTLRGEGIVFETLEAPFAYDSDRKRLTLNDFRTHGASLGITGRGMVWLGSNHIDLAGSIIPAYALNSLVGKIPLIGQILTGFEKDGGLIGANYAIQGIASSPQISVNPLSALAPGFLRRLFNLGQGTTTEEQEGQPAPSP